MRLSEVAMYRIVSCCKQTAASATRHTFRRTQAGTAAQHRLHASRDVCTHRLLVARDAHADPVEDAAVEVEDRRQLVHLLRVLLPAPGPSSAPDRASHKPLHFDRLG
eukprot:97724-Rhodomonas_salina.2